jgi:hypothetical protein
MVDCQDEVDVKAIDNDDGEADPLRSPMTWTVLSPSLLKSKISLEAYRRQFGMAVQIPVINGLVAC